MGCNDQVRVVPRYDNSDPDAFDMTKIALVTLRVSLLAGWVGNDEFRLPWVETAQPKLVLRVSGETALLNKGAGTEIPPLETEKLGKVAGKKSKTAKVKK
jgi:hypothetical protein